MGGIDSDRLVGWMGRVAVVLPRVVVVVLVVTKLGSGSTMRMKIVGRNRTLCREPAPQSTKTHKVRIAGVDKVGP